MPRRNAIIDLIIGMTEEKENLPEIIKQNFNQNVLLTSPLSKETDIKGVKHNLCEWITAFPDLKTVKSDIQIYSNMAILKWIIEGTHENVFFDMQPLGNRFISSGLAVCEFNSDNLIGSISYQPDMLDFTKQLGFHLQPEMYPRQKIIKRQYRALLELIMSFRSCKKILTEKEALCFSFYCLGYTARQIADLFKNSIRTIQAHLSNSIEKLACNSKQQLIEMVKSAGMMHMIRDFTELVFQMKRAP